MDAHWAEFYTNLKDLKIHSSFSIRGEISKIGSPYKTSDGLVFSQVTVTVKQVLFNPRHMSVPLTVSFLQNGGVYNKTTYLIRDDPLFAPKQQVILFFKEYSPGKYKITGGPSGRFIVEKGKVRAVDTEGVKISDTTSESLFSTQIQQS
jgi:hypothetical protein